MITNKKNMTKFIKSYCVDFILVEGQTKNIKNKNNQIIHEMYLYIIFFKTYILLKKNAYNKAFFFIKLF